MYVSHHQVSSRLLGIRPGQHVTIAGVPVERLPDGPGFNPKCGTFRVAGGEPGLLLISLDRVMERAGFRPGPDLGYHQGDGDYHEGV
jgi:hypothetical protein